jgi:DNA polymerase
MADSSLPDLLRFYRDLGFREIRAPRVLPAPVAQSAAAPQSRTPLRRSAAPPEQSEAPPQWNYRPSEDLPAAEDGKRNPEQLLDKIRDDMGECTRCVLHQGRSTIVFGSGKPSAKIVFVGEGPGADEDAQGLPFVGRAGQLLTQMINNTATGEGIPIQREDVYICNIVKCRPPGNRAPELEEMKTCGQFLDRQLDAIRPKAICVLGGTAAKYLLESRLGITKIRGKWHDWHGIPVMPTFHPSFLLRAYNKEGKRQAWEDLKKVLHYVYDA